MMKKNVICLSVLSASLFAAAYFMENPVYFSYKKRVAAGDFYLSRNDTERAENAYKQAARFDTELYDEWAGLAYIYNSTEQENDYANACKALAEKGVEEKYIPRLLNAYAELPGSGAVDIEIEDVAGFNYYDENGTLVIHRADTTNGQYKNCLVTKYVYDTHGRVAAKYNTGFENGRETQSTEEYSYTADSSEKISKYIKTIGKEKYEEKFYYNDNGSLIKSEINYYSPLSEKWYVDGIKTYQNNLPVQYDKYSRVRYDDIYLDYTDYYNDSGMVVKRTDYSVEGETEFYHLYTYPDNNTTVDEEYTPDNIINQRITATVSVNGTETVTQLFDLNGNIVKTVTEHPDGTQTVERAYDDLINPRPLTEDEIAQVNEHQLLLGALTGGGNGSWYKNIFEYPQEIDISFLQNTMRNSWLTIYDKREVINLQADGMEIDYENMEFTGQRYHRISYDKAQELREKYLGLSLEVFEEELWDTYSARYNCFYIPKVDSYGTTPRFECIGGVAGDNMVKLYSHTSTLYLKPYDDRYIIAAHVNEDHSELIPPKKEYSQKIKEVFIHTDPTKSAYYNKALQAYNDFLDEMLPDEYNPYKKDYYYRTYALYDITGDGLPELFYEEFGGGIYTDIYTYKNGRVEALPDSFGNGHHGPSKVLKCGMVANEHSSTGITYYFTVYYPDGSTKSAVFGHCVTGDPYNDYHVEGDWVTREEYIAYAREYMTAWTSEEVQLEWENILEYANE